MTKLKALRMALENETDESKRKEIEEQIILAIEEEATEKVRKELAEEAEKKAAESRQKDADEASKKAYAPSIKMTGIADEHNGVKIKKVVAKMQEKLAARTNGRVTAANYLGGDDEAKEFVARFWIDKVQNMQVGPVTKANELITTTASLGGNLTPTEQEDALIGYVRHMSIALQDADVIPMTSDVMTIPVRGTEPAVTFESAQTTITQATPTYGLATLTAKRASGYVPVAWEVTMNETAGLAAALADGFYEDLGLKIDSATFLEPAGTLVEGSGVMVNYGVSAVMASGSTNFSSVYTGVVFNTESALYPERRMNAKVYVAYNYATYLKQLTYGTDMPLYNPMEKTLLGYPVRELRQGIASAASKPLFILGDLRHFKIGSRLITTQLRVIPEKTGMDSYVFFTNVAFANPLPNAFAACKTAAS